MVVLQENAPFPQMWSVTSLPRCICRHWADSGLRSRTLRCLWLFTKKRLQPGVCVHMSAPCAAPACYTSTGAWRVLHFNVPSIWKTGSGPAQPPQPPQTGRRNTKNVWTLNDLSASSSLHRSRQSEGIISDSQQGDFYSPILWNQVLLLKNDENFFL